jgi:hypothetical protein
LDFLERAKSTIAKGVPVIRLKPESKIAWDLDWPNLATTDLKVLEKWNNETPDANCAAVAKAQLGGVFFLEIDDPSVVSRIEQETGQKIPQTFRVRSRPGRGHYYWLQTPKSLELGNVAQGFVKNEDFSVRVADQYVVSANSIHPISKNPYEIVSTSDINPAPDWLIDWIKNQQVEKKRIVSADSSEPIPEHARNDSLISIGGGLRQKGLIYDEIRMVLGRINRERCTPPLDEDEVDTISRSASKYALGKESIVLTYASKTPILGGDEEETVSLQSIPYPKFPEWVMLGTSVYEGLVKPFCDVNSRYPEFLFMPAVTLMLNFVATKVRVETKDLIPSIFMVSIGRAGRVIKSSCVRDAVKFFEYMGCVGHGESTQNNANGRSLIFTAGSIEGFGKEMNRQNCFNGILFYDELKSLSDKAGIESSDLASKLLTMYESDKAQNNVKNTKDGYAFKPGTYCVSLIACTTDKKFNTYWSKLCGSDTGLTDRFFFLLQPEVLKEVEPYISVSTQQASIKTRQLIDRAIQKGTYKIADTSPLREFLRTNQNNNRAEIRAEKFALYFAIDLGLDELDENCIERGLALVEYELKVKNYLRVYDAFTKEGSVQQEIIHQLRKAGGSMVLRDMFKLLHPERYGTSLWQNVYLGLIKHGWCEERGAGTRGDPKKIVLLRTPEDDD